MNFQYLYASYQVLDLNHRLRKRIRMNGGFVDLWRIRCFPTIPKLEFWGHCADVCYVVLSCAHSLLKRERNVSVGCQILQEFFINRFHSSDKE